MLLARLIPAHAGKTRTPWPGRYGQAAHPRSRGENTWLLPRGQRARGSSPLTRGKRRRPTRQPRPPRLIPAHAGKTRCDGHGRGLHGAHPRSRGENRRPWRIILMIHGSSPLTRGKQRRGGQPIGGPRLIPAHAGKTVLQTLNAHSSAAHPRSRGENLPPGGGLRNSLGSSPLTRGKLRLYHVSPQLGGLIPAHAGKTAQPRRRTRRGRAHPRSRGENRAAPVSAATKAGSSPLTRGKPWWLPALLSDAGLIPAHAGKTLPDLRFYCADRSDLGNP